MNATFDLDHKSPIFRVFLAQINDIFTDNAGGMSLKSPGVKIFSIHQTRAPFHLWDHVVLNTTTLCHSVSVQSVHCLSQSQIHISPAVSGGKTEGGGRLAPGLRWHTNTTQQSQLLNTFHYWSLIFRLLNYFWPDLQMKLLWKLFNHQLTDFTVKNISSSGLLMLKTLVMGFLIWKWIMLLSIN